MDVQAAQQATLHTAQNSARNEAALKQFVSNLPGQNAGGDASPSKNWEKMQKAALESARRLSGSSFNKKLQFVVDHESADVTVRVIDRETDEVIKVLPPEELRRINRGLQVDEGVLLDELA
jgi:flagellar protein FlaG